jgi:hypothetical protein
MGLDERDRGILSVEARSFPNTGAKLTAIRELGLSEVRYYQRLNTLLDDQRAVEYAPMLVHRLRRLRAVQRRTARG